MPNRRTWILIASIGCGLVCLTLFVVALVLFDKTHFGSLVGSNFLVVITSMVFVGALAMLIAALMLPERKTWRGLTLIAWALIALTSPLFGWLFLFPWGVLALTLPLIIIILRQWRRV